jgi:hypothetical protein
VASCGEKELGIAVAEVDLNYVDQIRSSMPVFTHRRADIYGPTLSGPLPLSKVGTNSDDTTSEDGGCPPTSESHAD